MDEKNFEISSKIIRITFFIICLTGCLYQTYKICENYFSFEINTYVRYEDEDKISLPAITVCIKKHFLIREKYLSQFSSREESLNYTAIDLYLNTLTNKEQFNAIYSAKEVFNNSCNVMKTMAFNGSQIQIKCDLISPIRQSIDYYKSCFTFFSQLNGENNDRYYIDYDLSIKNYWAEEFGIRVNLNIPQLFLFLHSRHEMITDSFEDNRVNITFIPHYTSITKYHITKVQLMPKPYKTSCVDYKKFGYRSRYDCILKCRINYYRKNFKGWPGIYLTDDSSDEYMLNVLEILLKNESLDLELGKLCRKFCGIKIDCFREYFSFTESRIEYDANSTIFIYPPNFPSLIFEHSPKMQLEQFICFIASIVNLWVGLSILMLLDVCSLIFRVFFQNY
jgi:hypothetical protein